MAKHDLDAFLAELDREPETVTLGGSDWPLPTDVTAGEILAIKRHLALIGELQARDQQAEATEEDKEHVARALRFDLDAQLRRLAGEDLYTWIKDNVPGKATQAVFWRLVAAHEGAGGEKSPEAKRGPKTPQDRRSPTSVTAGGP